MRHPAFQNMNRTARRGAEVSPNFILCRTASHLHPPSFPEIRQRSPPVCTPPHSCTRPLHFWPLPRSPVDPGPFCPESKLLPQDLPPPPI